MSEDKLIHKTTLPIIDNITVRLPKDADILTFQEQNGEATIWYSFPKANKDRLEERRFLIVGTGQTYQSDDNLKYVQTWQFRNGLVWHLFEDKP